jgi:hypothetical protein
MPNEPQGPRRPDAILCPRRYGCGPSEDRDYKFKALFGPTLGRSGAGLVFTRQILGTQQVLVSPDHDPLLTSYYLPQGHPNQGEPRYDWFVAELRDGRFTPVAPVEGHPGEDDVVKVGYLRDDPHRQDAAARQKVVDDLAARQRESAADPAFHGELLKRGIITRAEHDRRLTALGVDVEGTKGGTGPAPAPGPVTEPAPEKEAKPDGDTQRGGTPTA